MGIGDAEEINGYNSKVMYNRSLQSIADGNPFESVNIETITGGNTDESENTSDEGVSDDEMTGGDPEQEMSDILPEEMDFLPENPESILE